MAINSIYIFYFKDCFIFQSAKRQKQQHTQKTKARTPNFCMG